MCIIRGEGSICVYDMKDLNICVYVRGEGSICVYEVKDLSV